MGKQISYMTLIGVHLTMHLILHVCTEHELCSYSSLPVSLPSLCLSLSLPPLPPPSPSLFLPAAQLLKEAQGYAQVTPLQVSYLFELCSMEEKTAGSISLGDFQRLLPRPTPLSQCVATHQPSGSTKSSEVHIILLFQCSVFSKINFCQWEGMFLALKLHLPLRSKGIAY